MKKTTFLLLTLFLSVLSFGQVLTEDFEGGLTLPPGWTNNDIAGGGDIWTFATGGEAVGFTPPNTIYYDNALMAGNYALFDSDGYGNNSIAENCALESPVFSCAGLTQVTLNYNHFFTEGYGGAAFVEVFNGSSWVQVATYSTQDFGLVSLDVTTELAGVANAQVRFRWTGDWAWGWAFDNVSVFECTVVAPDAVASVVSPANMAIDVPINIGSTTNSVGPFEWTPAGTGDPADSFNFNLGTTVSGDDIGTISGFTNGGDVFYAFDPSTTYYWRVDAVNCAGTTPGPVWSFTTAACTDSAPSAVTTPGPTDGALDVPLDNSDSNFPNRVYFSWVDGLLGDPGEAFTLNLGTQNPPTDNSFGNFTNGDFIFGLSESTTYFWSVEAINCGGASTPTVWSFTTEAALDVDDNTVDLFKVYPNPVKDILNIDTTLEIDQIEIFNLIGQRVMSFNGNSVANNSINLSDLDNGLYMAIISAEDKRETIRITKE